MSNHIFEFASVFCGAGARHPDWINIGVDGCEFCWDAQISGAERQTGNDYQWHRRVASACPLASLSKHLYAGFGESIGCKKSVESTKVHHAMAHWGSHGRQTVSHCCSFWESRLSRILPIPQLTQEMWGMGVATSELQACTAHLTYPELCQSTGRNTFGIIFLVMLWPP